LQQELAAARAELTTTKQRVLSLEHELAIRKKKYERQKLTLKYVCTSIRTALLETRDTLPRHLAE
jgi:molecular chaperone GrpE (heat shock protein)